MPEELRTIVEEAGATRVISRGRLLDLCGQRSKEEGGSCDGSLVQAVCKDLALSQEDDPQAPADQVRNLCDDRQLAIPCEIPVRFKSSIGYNSKNENLDSFQTKSGSSPELLALVRKISQKERTRCKYQQQCVFRYRVQTSIRKQQNRPTKFKLAYAQNASNLDKVGFGIKSCKKAKIYRKKANDKFWNPYVYLIMCISMICIYLLKQVNKWQPVELPSSTSGFVKLYAEVKMAPKTCQIVRKHYDKSNGNFWDIYGYVKMYICMTYMYLTKQVNKLKRKVADENQRLGQIIYNS